MEKQRFRQVIELRGHIIDSLILPRILDALLDLSVEFTIQRLTVGRSRTEPSYARIEVVTDSPASLESVLREMQRLGASPVHVDQVKLTPAPIDGVFPEDFYSTTNLRTQVMLDGDWTDVANPEMDCGIVVEGKSARCVPISETKKGNLVVVGRDGIRVTPLERPRSASSAFGFMGSSVSSEKPKSMFIREIADRLAQTHSGGGKIAVVAGPAIIHTGAGDALANLIDRGYVDYLFAGNALATHDIEGAFFGTSLGISIDGGLALEGGHEHHLRAINRIRMAGGIRQAVASGMLHRGVMYTCVKKGVDFVLAGSIRDDGPLPEVITDVVDAQVEMRRRIHSGVEMCLMLSTMLHSIAVGNMLPASVFTVCVDINPSTLTKLVDRGSFQSVGLVMDVCSFLRELVGLLESSNG